MYIKYGSFQFEPWEASLTSVVTEARYSVRKFKETLIVQYLVNGTVVESDQYDITTRLNQIAAALATDGQDFGLYHDDNTPTIHYLQSSAANNLTGNQVARTSFPTDNGAEYVTGRDFSFVIQAEIADFETSLIEYRDSYNSVGDCGPVYDWSVTEAGVIVRKTAPASVQTVTHSGYAITTVPYFQPPPPYYSAPFHLSHRRQIAYTGPSRYPQGFTGYKTEWSYTYVLPVDIYNVPTVR